MTRNGVRGKGAWVGLKYMTIHAMKIKPTRSSLRVVHQSPFLFSFSCSLFCLPFLWLHGSYGIRSQATPQKKVNWDCGIPDWAKPQKQCKYPLPAPVWDFQPDSQTKEVWSDVWASLGWAFARFVFIISVICQQHWFEGLTFLFLEPLSKYTSNNPKALTLQGVKYYTNSSSSKRYQSSVISRLHLRFCIC